MESSTIDTKNELIIVINLSLTDNQWQKLYHETKMLVTWIITTVNIKCIKKYKKFSSQKVNKFSKEFFRKSKDLNILEMIFLSHQRVKKRSLIVIKRNMIVVSFKKSFEKIDLPSLNNWWFLRKLFTYICIFFNNCSAVKN